MGDNRWGDAAAREQWVRDWVADPAHLKRENRDADWVHYQRAHAGDHEVLVYPAGGSPEDGVWADGLVLDSDRFAVVVDAKFVTRSDGRAMYEGGRPDFLYEKLDGEFERYAAVIADPENPISELRIVTSTEKAAEFLGARARGVMGPDVSVDVRVEVTAPGEAPTPSVSPTPPSADLAPSKPAPAKAGGLPMEEILERELLRMTDAQVAEVARKAVAQYPYGRPPWMAPLERRVQMPPPKPVPGTEVYPTPAEMKATLKAAVAKMSPDEIAVASTKARALHPHGQFPDWMEPLTDVMPPLPPPPPPPPISPESMEASQRAADSVKRNWPNASEAADRAPMPKRRSAPRPKPAKALGKVLRRK